MTDQNDLEQVADQIIAEGRHPAPSPIVSAVESGTRLTSGSERGGELTHYDPATLLRDPAPESLATLPATRSGGSVSTTYVTSAGISSLDYKVHDARRRDEDAELGQTKAAAKAWAEFLDAADEARRLVRDIPAAMRRAQAARAEVLADPGDAPVVLPSVADARAHAEAVAGKALRHALELRTAYDEVVQETAGERLSALAKSVPTEAAALREAVTDLHGRLTRLRAGVDALVEQAADGDPAVGRAKMPSRANLEHLDDVVAEVEALVAVSESPTVRILVPTLEQRRAIVAQSRGVVGGLTEDYIALAVREEDEGWKHTRLAGGVPQHIRESYRRDGYWRAL